MKLKYSIIVPIYKVERYLSECIESVLHQTCTDYELILVDDGSPDACPHICDSYVEKNNRIKVVHKKNGGLVSARKAGLAVASGEYAVCLDGDDFLDENCLKKVSNVIDKYNPDVVCFGYIIFSDKKEKQNPIYCPYYGFYSRNNIENDIFPQFIHTCSEKRFPPVLWSKIFRMNLYKEFQNKVSSEISMGEDGACSYPLISHCNSMYIMEDCLYYYRQIPEAMTKVRRSLDWDNYDKVFALYEQEIELDKYKLRSQIYRARTHNLFNLCVSQFYCKKKYRCIVNEIKDRFLRHPEYNRYIIESDFSSIKMRLARFVLLYKIYPVIYLCSKVIGK